MITLSVGFYPILEYTVLKIYFLSVILSSTISGSVNSICYDTFVELSNYVFLSVQMYFLVSHIPYSSGSQPVCRGIFLGVPPNLKIS